MEASRHADLEPAWERPRHFVARYLSKLPDPVQDAVADVPVLELADQDQPELWAQAFKDDAECELKGGPFDPEIERAADADEPEHSPQQRIVAALLLRSLAACKPGFIDHLTMALIIPFLFLVLAGVGFLTVLVIYYPLAWGNWLFGDRDGGLLYLLPAGLLLIVSPFKNINQTKPIEVTRNAGKITLLKLGRLHDTFAGGTSANLLMGGLLLGWQAGLLYCVPDICGLPDNPTVG